MGRILITDHAWPAVDLETTLLERAGHQIVVGRPEPGTATEIEQLVAEHLPDAIMACWAPVSKRAIGLGPGLKVVARIGVGLDNIDVAACTERGVWVTNVPDYCVEEVSDHAVAFLLDWTRGITAFDGNVKAGHWRPQDAQLRRLSELTIGVIGYGRIARRTLEKLAPWNGRLLVWNRTPIADQRVTQVTLDELLRQADAVIIHVPLTPETRALIDKAALARMKPGAFLINVARGGVVDSHALERAVRAGRLSGAGLDVLDDETNPPRGLVELPQVRVTPHLAFSSTASLVDLRSSAVRCVLSVLGGDVRPLNACNAPRTQPSTSGAA